MNYIKIDHISCRNAAAIFIGVLLVSGVTAAHAETTPATHIISGAVSGAILAGVTINLSGPATASATTNAEGKYNFAALPNGSYTVTPSRIGFTFNPASFAVSVTGVNVSVKDFTATGQINDTGTSIASQCYQAGSDIVVACNSRGAIALSNAQDAMTGRDVNAVTNNNADGKLGFSFSAVPGGCVLDNVTGLMWEVKTADGGLRDWTKTYTNYNSIKTTPKPNAVKFVVPTQAEIDAPTNSVSFKNSVNAQGLCGYSDWRLPTPDELQSIVDYGIGPPGPTIDTTWFPNTQGKEYWSGSTDVADPLGAWLIGRAWLIGMDDGHVGLDVRSNAYYVRLVRTAQ